MGGNVGVRNSLKSIKVMQLEGQYAQGAGYWLRGDSPGERGYAMAALLVAIASMSVMMTMAMPVWKQANQREKEAELIFRAGQYTRAIELFRRKSNALPSTVDILVKGKFLRKKYKDPITGNDFRLLSPLEMQAVTGGVSTRPGLPGLPGPVGNSSRMPGGNSPTLEPPAPRLPGREVAPGREGLQGPIAGVASRSTAKSIRIYKNRQQYDQWRVLPEDVIRRPNMGDLQPNQPGQRPGTGFPGTGPGTGQPGPRPSGFGTPGSGGASPSRPPPGVR